MRYTYLHISVSRCNCIWWIASDLLELRRTYWVHIFWNFIVLTVALISSAITVQVASSISTDSSLGITESIFLPYSIIWPRHNYHHNCLNTSKVAYVSEIHWLDTRFKWYVYMYNYSVKSSAWQLTSILMVLSLSRVYSLSLTCSIEKTGFGFTVSCRFLVLGTGPSAPSSRMV